jgi:hypothetical protein
LRIFFHDRPLLCRNVIAPEASVTNTSSVSSAVSTRSPVFWSGVSRLPWRRISPLPFDSMIIRRDPCEYSPENRMPSAALALRVGRLAAVIGVVGFRKASSAASAVRVMPTPLRFASTTTPKRRDGTMRITDP